ncbi:GHMP family kinase ATP-binding protein [Metabacillus bambusae]|uniref:Kinase n=1 Tax=Metabacillus bambusae TaxID=2795218 RepID=A0ABS3MZS5_9BACI|nr:kinase [Metabacillus bambusae]MBO1511399.1 kinase [Metabacillus bambusae]
MQIGYGTCNGTFGELAQGVINQQPFLITLPVPLLKSKATFIPDPIKMNIIAQPSQTKAVMACKKMFELFNLSGGGTLHLFSNIPRGKGMASSSADIVASIRAVAHSYSIQLSHEVISNIATEIEPTDGVMYEGTVAYDYINGQLIDSFGDLPPYGIIGIDIGGRIDTIQFNKRRKPYTELDHQTFIHAFHLIKEGIKKKDLTLICQASTMSAKVSEKALPKRYFKEIERLAGLCEGGIVVAHSGTVLGILFDPTKSIIEKNRLLIEEFIHQTKTTPFYYCHKNLYLGSKNLILS